MADMAGETCANCGRQIGKLETPMVWKQHVVCQACRKLLQDSESGGHQSPGGIGHAAGAAEDSGGQANPPAAGYDANAYDKATEKILGQPGHNPDAYPKGAFDARVCPNPNCSYEGEGIVRRRGSWIVLIFLLLLGFFSGLLYALLYSGHRTSCPKCGMDWGPTRWVKLRR